MLNHTHKTEVLPSRVVILGGGFVSNAIKSKLEERGVDLLSLRKADLDLSNPNAVQNLIKLLLPDDTVLFVAAKAPVKNEEMLIENLQIGRAICEALRKIQPSHLVYISSDAVYSDSTKPLNEDAVCSPDSLHGIMHLAREVMLKNAYSGPLCILRPTLIFGENDPHNGYGPNRFIRLVKNGENIVLFGEGEERRDHVWIEDVAELGARVVMRKSHGILNMVTGQVNSFREIAETISKKASNKSKVVASQRLGPMPHNGYREFDSSQLSQTFPDFKCTSVLEWIKNNN